MYNYMNMYYPGCDQVETLTFGEWMQECWNQELNQDLQEQADLAADIRREHEEAEEDLRRELESYED